MEDSLKLIAKSSPLLNQKTLQYLLTNVGQENSDMIIQLYLTQSKSDLEYLLTSFEQGDVMSITQLCHKMSSSALYYGLESLSSILKSIEDMHHDQISSNLHKVAQLVDDCYSQSVEELLLFLAKQ